MVDVQDVHLTGVQPICHSGVCQGSGIAIMRTDFELFQVAILLILCLLGLAAVLQQWTIPGVPPTTQREKFGAAPGGSARKFGMAFGEGMGKHPERKNETGTIYKSSAEPIRNYL